ncbi:DNA repair protein RecO [Pelagibacterium luteolum]|uniref:DNA repair protein RecO n=1 Tax=Pelagibacterium luteolum TaxID=440168 RepID=A0A1G7WGG9_9HYPH|nr:DNA repair protein RecO C-terminal domain-containing protein [Pelagibacterium luteolum]SDG71056.1 DNA replication and repair protein RecO [Pelagibacterium luteolum]
MEWSGEGLIIGVRRHGESAVIVEAMVPGRGRCLGLIRGGRSPKQAASLQLGNSAQLVWRARLEDHLGTFVAEVTRMRAAELMADRQKLYLIQLLADHLRLLPERDPHDELLAVSIALIDGDWTKLSAEPGLRSNSRSLGAELARFEMFLLEELGFGLDLQSCAVTGVQDNLTFVSPKSGRAVSTEAAEPYRDRLLRLPQFLVDDVPASLADIGDAFALTGHFLDRHIWTPRQSRPPETRDWLIRHLAGTE